MAEWKHTVKIRHLFTEDESSEAIQKSMTAIGEVLMADRWFDGFELRDEFKYVKEVDEANDALAAFYDYCDAERIWVAL